MKNKIYIVTAYRNGNTSQHSYNLGAFTKKAQAIKHANSHAEYRGGGYACVVNECVLDHFDNADYNYTNEIYRAKSNQEMRRITISNS